MSSATVLAFVGLGSNLDRPQRQVLDALAELDDMPQSHLLRHSSLYRSAPLGPAGQPDYINAVAAVETRLAPSELLDALQAVEQRHGRVRGVHWGPRTLDLDILAYGSARIRTDRLVVPHPQLQHRAFVLIPLHEIAPDLRIPGLGTLHDLLEGVSMEDLHVIDGAEDA